MKTIEHGLLNIRVDLIDVTQGKLEAFLRKRRELDGDSPMLAAHRGNTARAALDAGLFTSFQAVDDMRPNVVAWLAEQIEAHIGESLEVPPAYSSAPPDALREKA